MKKNLLLILSLSFAGCVAVPSTKIDLSKGTFTSPKDDAFAGVKVSFQNGQGVLTTAEFATASAQNNPAVISATGVAQGNLTTIYFQGARDLLQLIGQYAAAGAGVPVPLAGLGGALNVPAVSNVVTHTTATNAPSK